MDPVGAITSITGQVLRRIADSIDTPRQDSREVHIHLHLPADTPPHEEPARNRMGVPTPRFSRPRRDR